MVVGYPVHTTRVGREDIQCYTRWAYTRSWVHLAPCYCSGRHHCTDPVHGDGPPGSERKKPMGERLSSASGPQECYSSYASLRRVTPLLPVRTDE